MKLLKLYKLAKSRGYVFESVTRRFGRVPGSAKVIMRYKTSRIVISNTNTRGEILEDLTKLRAEANRREMRIVRGGYAWVPNDLIVGEPRGKLKLVA